MYLVLAHSEIDEHLMLLSAVHNLPLRFASAVGIEVGTEVIPAASVPSDVLFVLLDALQVM